MAANVVMPASIADNIGRQYNISDKLGKGGFAVCYRTEINGQQLALKVSRTTEMNEKLRDKLITELQIHSKVRHANIVQFHRAFSVEDNTYIALELCPNGNLKEMLSYRGRISMPETRRFGLQLCGALHYLHSKRVIHRDIKTANILLDEQMNIKLADFGLAAVLVTDEEMGEVKRRVTVCGTPNYIAPEILHKKKGHDTKADIWSLGVLFYNMLTGCMPFSKPEDKCHDAVFKRVAEGSFNWPESASKSLSPAVLDLVNQMLVTVDIDRPEALEVAYHDFFRLGAIPAKLEPSFTRSRPIWLKKTDPQDMRMNAKTISHEAMLVACGLDEGIATRPPLAEIGQESEPTRAASNEGNKIPLSHLLLHEFNQGLVPTLPLRSVYEPIELSMQGPLKMKPRRPLNPAKATISRKDGLKAKESEQCSSIDPRSGHLLEHTGADLRTMVANVYNIMKGRPVVSDRPMTGLPPVVLITLDTEKWGLGYVLLDGSIGLLSDRRLPEKALLIPNGIQHFKNYQDPKDAPLLPFNVPVYFYERAINAPVGSTSSSSSFIPPQIRFYSDTAEKYPSILSTAQSPTTKYKLDPSNADIFQLERIRTLSLWSRYATYLTVRVRMSDLDVAVSSASPESYLSMWQTLGNVQAWHWIGNPDSPDHGGYEFTFSDSTKIALSQDGIEARFTYDPQASLQSELRVSSKSSVKCEMMEFPLTTLVNCSAKKNPLIHRVLEANHFKPKLEFVRDVLVMWLSNKGVGKTGTTKMAYKGPLVGMKPQEDDIESLKYSNLML